MRGAQGQLELDKRGGDDCRVRREQEGKELSGPISTGWTLEVLLQLLRIALHD